MFEIIDYNTLKERYLELRKKSKKNNSIFENETHEEMLKESLSLLNVRVKKILTFFEEKDLIINFESDNGLLEFEIEKEFIFNIKNPNMYPEEKNIPNIFILSQKKHLIYDIELTYNFKKKDATIRINKYNFLTNEGFHFEFNDKENFELEIIYKIIETDIKEKINIELKSFDSESLKNKIYYLNNYLTNNSILSYENKKTSFDLLSKNKESLNLNNLKESFELLNLRYDFIIIENKRINIKNKI